jgi:protein gp37
MPQRTNIEWADYSSNPLKFMFGDKRGWFCVKISPGCANCYAETINKRFGTLKAYIAANVTLHKPYLEGKELRHLLSFRHKPPYKNGRDRPIVFPFDMTDLFGAWVPDELIDTVMAMILMRQDVDFMILTKRAQRMRTYFGRLESGRLGTAVARLKGRTVVDDDWLKPWTADYVSIFERNDGVIPNLWLGVSAEDQQRMNERGPELLQTPAALRFYSIEPLLSEVVPMFGLATPYGYNRIKLAIVGGESGRGARDCNIVHVEKVIQACRAAGVDCFNKQLGSKPMHREGTAAELFYPLGVPEGLAIEGEYYLRRSLPFVDPKGGDWDEWPEQLRVRQMPGRALGGAIQNQESAAV